MLQVDALYPSGERVLMVDPCRRRDSFSGKKPIQRPDLKDVRGSLGPCR